MAINIGALFSYGLEATGEAFAERDASVKASAQASAEAFAKKREKYDDEITVNRNMLKKNAEAIRNSLGINEVGKIRTIISTYGAEDTMGELQKDFTNYQKGTILKSNDGKFKTLSDYVKGRISGTSNTFLNDAEAEQAADEAAVIGDELDIQKATDRAKAEGVTLEQYLNNKARSMSNRPSFDIDTRAAQLVKESKLGLFGGELTLEEAKKRIIGDGGMGEGAKDLGSTGYTLDRQSGLSAEDELKLQGLKREEELRETVGVTEINKLQKDIKAALYTSGSIKGVTNPVTKEVTYTDSDSNQQALIAEVTSQLNFANKQDNKDEKGIRTLKALLERLKGPQPKVKLGDLNKNKSESNTIKRDNKIKDFLKQGKNKNDIAQGMIISAKKRGKVLSLEDALKIIEGVVSIKKDKKEVGSVITDNPLGVTPTTKASEVQTVG